MRFFSSVRAMAAVWLTSRSSFTVSVISLSWVRSNSIEPARTIICSSPNRRCAAVSGMQMSLLKLAWPTPPGCSLPLDCSANTPTTRYALVAQQQVLTQGVFVAEQTLGCTIAQHGNVCGNTQIGVGQKTTAVNFQVLYLEILGSGPQDPRIGNPPAAVLRVLRKAEIGNTRSTVGNAALKSSKSRYFNPYSSTRLDVCCEAPLVESSTSFSGSGLTLRMMTFVAPS